MTLAPTGFTATPLGGFRNSLAWTLSATPGAVHVVERSLLGDFSDAVTAYTGTGTSYVDDRGVINGKCYFRLRANVGSVYSVYVYSMANNAIGDGITAVGVQLYGDSITAHVAADTEANGYAQKLSQYFNGDIGGVVGLGGFAITPNPSYAAWDYVTGGSGTPTRKFKARGVSDGFAIMAYGLNDTNSAASLPASSYQTAIENFIDYALTQGWTASRIIILGPFLGSVVSYASGGGTIDTTRRLAFLAAARTAALGRGAAFLSSYEFEQESGFVLADGLHPNTAQHAIIYQWLKSHLISTNAAVWPPETPTEPPPDPPTGIAGKSIPAFMFFS